MYLAVLDDQSSEEQFVDVYNTYKRLVYHMKQLRSLQVLRRPVHTIVENIEYSFMRELAHGRKDKSIFKREKQWQAKLVRRMCLLNICYIVWII